MIRRLLLLMGLVLLAVDVARLNITGLALAGVALMAIAAHLYGALTREFWIADDEESARLAAADTEVPR
ncbi:hypothetical protein [Microbacterium dauci]|uniref:4-hydroxybenzoate polyprenyltransferase n=1 Tax=Microbacterium dauci TaxID=3048008 RepID=A0ABT6ZAM7_9MICO|nr:hypothetical protein [Microbacterium sp. LX3-4]MDJ1113208.1 hypothetical protein [Microbacterium sp. LX3-4]